MKLLLVILLFVVSCSPKTQNCEPKIIERVEIIEKPIYIKPETPPLPQRPLLENVRFEKIGRYYCLTPEESKKLLQNLYKLDNYARELETVIRLILQEVNNNADSNKEGESTN